MHDGNLAKVESMRLASISREIEIYDSIIYDLFVIWNVISIIYGCYHTWNGTQTGKDQIKWLG